MSYLTVVYYMQEVYADVTEGPYFAEFTSEQELEDWISNYRDPFSFIRVDQILFMD